MLQKIQNERRSLQKVSEIWLKVMRYIFYFFLIIATQARAQEFILKEKSHFFGTEFSISYRSNEIFHGINYSLIKKRFLLFTGIKFGVKSSYFQLNIFPQFNLKSAYFIFNKEGIKKNKTLNLGPMLLINYGLQRIEKTHSFTDLIFGYEFNIGDKIRFNHNLGIGPYIETYTDQLNNRQKLNSINIQFSIGLNYAFN